MENKIWLNEMHFWELGTSHFSFINQKYFTYLQIWFLISHNIDRIANAKNGTYVLYILYTLSLRKFKIYLLIKMEHKIWLNNMHFCALKAGATNYELVTPRSMAWLITVSRQMG
jgi:hypothetical protein